MSNRENQKGGGVMRFVFLFVIFICTAFGETLRYAPLSLEKSEIILKQSEKFLNYLKEQTGIEFEIVYSSDYGKMLEDFANDKVDMAYLGPLPYLKLKSKTKSALPLVSFKEKSGKSKYSCSIFSLASSNIKTLEDIKHKTISLTQKLSTCGFLMTEYMLNEVGLSLRKDVNYFYANSHTNSILSVLMGESDAGSAKSEILEKYNHFGFNILAKTEPIQGFVLVVNSNTVSEELAKKIKKSLLKLKPLENSDDFEITKEWGGNLRYGCDEVFEHDFKTIEDAYKRIKIDE